MVSAVRCGQWHPAQRPNSFVENETTAAGETAGQTCPADPVEARYQLITEVADLQAFLAIARKQGFVAVDTETTSLNAAAADLVGVAMALAPGNACYVPLRHGSAQNLATSLDRPVWILMGYRTPHPSSKSRLMMP